VGRHAEPALRKALAGKPCLEVKQRLEALLQRLESARLSPDTVRQVRAVEALEAIGTPAAREVLGQLAVGPPGTHLTREAKTSLGRLAMRATPGP
jgi:hypothetical protein